MLQSESHERFALEHISLWDDKGRGRLPALNSAAQLAFFIIFLFLGETQLPKYKAEAAVVALNEISRSRLS